MINENKKMSKREKSMSVFQIALLLTSLVAFGYITGEFARDQEIEVSYGLGVVSAEEEEIDCPEGFEPDPDFMMCVPIEEEPRGGETQGLDGEEGASTPTDSDPMRYEDLEEGRWVGGLDEDGNVDAYQIREGDVEDGRPKEGSGLDDFMATTRKGMEVASIPTSIYGTIKGYERIADAIRGIGKAKEAVEAGAAASQGASGATQLGWFQGIAISVAGAVAGSLINYAIFKSAFGGDARNMRDVTEASLGGMAIGAVIGTAASQGYLAALPLISATPGVGQVFLVAAAAALITSFIISISRYQWYSQEVFIYTVEAWRAPTGGEYCNLCNELPYGCSEYECKSFGRACELINRGTDNELCVWHEPEDISPPHITELEEVLPGFDPLEEELVGDYRYDPIRDEEGVLTGVQIFYEKDEDDPERGCIPPYTAVTLGIETNKYASCRIDTERGLSYDQMTAPMTSFEGYQDKHILEIPHSATPSEESQRRAGVPDYLIRNGELVQFYIRCESFNGFPNREDYIMEFCVQDGPDLLPPEIVGTNYEEETHIMYNQTSLPIQIYTDKPTEACNWDVVDRRYEEMENNITDCTNEVGDMLPGFNYGCGGEITGLRDREDNTVYIRCKSAEEGRVSEESYVLTFKGTQPLIIDEVTINGQANGSVIKDSVSDIRVRFEVETSFGADNGKAICYHDLRTDGKFYNEGSMDYHRTNTHSTSLRASEDGVDYEVEIRCHDKGSNWAETVIEFTLETDRSPPIVVGAFRTERELNILTDKPSECVYSKDTQERCRYAIEDGLPMTADGRGMMHKVTWEPGDVFYIKCQDEFGNQPHQPDECSAIVRPFEER